MASVLIFSEVKALTKQALELSGTWGAGELENIQIREFQVTSSEQEELRINLLNQKGHLWLNCGGNTF